MRGPGLSFLAIAALVLGLSLFIAAQLVMIYRPGVNPVPIASPLAEEWLVGQGGHAELVNYHHVTSTQRDAHDILQVRDGRTHQPGSTELTSYYIYGKPVLAPAAGTVTFVLDGRPDVPIGSTDSQYKRKQSRKLWQYDPATPAHSGPKRRDRHRRSHHHRRPYIHSHATHLPAGVHRCGAHAMRY